MKHYYAFVMWVFLFAHCQAKPEPDAPNVIVILADDLGYHDLGCYGNEAVSTPHIDQMAKNGILFTDFHSNGAVCSPTRASLLTGKYPQKTGIQGVITAKNHRDVGLHPIEFTLADYFKSKGYRTGITGKWHLGYDTAYSPLQNGFDYFFGYVSGNVDYHSHIDQTGNYDWWENKDTIAATGYSTDLIGNAASAFIEKHSDQPFFLYVAHEAPHYPYQGRNDPADRTVSGDFPVLGSRKDRKVAYREMIEAMDDQVGLLLNTLDHHGLMHRTLIIFVSDNGATQVGSNNPLRGFKGSLWEGGHRVPAILYGPDFVSPGENNELWATMDIFPTMVEWTRKNEEVGHIFDGRSFAHLITGKNKPLPQRQVFWKYKNQRAVRTENWKYLENKDSRYLFRLETDLGEEINLIDRYPVRADSLRNALNQWENQWEAEELIAQ